MWSYGVIVVKCDDEMLRVKCVRCAVCAGDVSVVQHGAQHAAEDGVGAAPAEVHQAQESAETARFTRL